MEKKLIFSDNDVIGNGYRIYQGDCIDVLKKLPEKSVDLIFAEIKKANLRMQLKK